MKKLLALLLAAAMLLTFAACASKPAETQTPAETTTEETAAPAAETETKTEEAPAAETTDGIVAGRGFIALAAVIFGRWNAGGILLACLFFGFCDALQIKLQVSGIAIPYQFFQMIPYLATVLVLSLIGAKQAGPRANGQPYRREQR